MFRNLTIDQSGQIDQLGTAKLVLQETARAALEMMISDPHAPGKMVIIMNAVDGLKALSPKR